MNERTHITREGLQTIIDALTADLEISRRTQEEMQNQLAQQASEIERLRFALTRVTAIGSTGTIFQSDFEYAVNIAKQALSNE